MAYRYRLILMATQPSVVGEPVIPTETVTGTWTKPAPLAVSGARLNPAATGTKPTALAVSGTVTFARTVS